MKVYKGLFFLLFKFFQSVRGDFITYTDDAIAFKVAVILSVFPIINLSSFRDKLNLGERFFIFCALLIFNYLIFVYKDRYTSIVKEFRLTPPSALIKFIGLAYLGLTLTVFFLLP